MNIHENHSWYLHQCDNERPLCYCSQVVTNEAINRCQNRSKWQIPFLPVEKRIKQNDQYVCNIIQKCYKFSIKNVQKECIILILAFREYFSLHADCLCASHSFGSNTVKGIGQGMSMPQGHLMVCHTKHSKKLRNNASVFIYQVNHFVRCFASLIQLLYPQGTKYQALKQAILLQYGYNIFISHIYL